MFKLFLIPLYVIPLFLFLFVVPSALTATGAPSIGDTPDAIEKSAENARTVDVGEARAANHEMDRRAKSRPATSEPTAATPPHLQAIAACESGGNPRAVSSNGMYLGKYQFSTATWQAVGGSGNPAAASETEQDKRAAMLYAQSGAGQWPVCDS